jgi:hypothetical protein
MPDPDLTDQELAYNLVLAEKVQKGKMTLIERDAAAAQFPGSWPKPSGGFSSDVLPLRGIWLRPPSPASPS